MMADNDDKTILDDVLDNKRDDKFDEKDVTSVPVPLEDEFPDGGFQGWLTVFGVCVLCSVFLGDCLTRVLCSLPIGSLSDILNVGLFPELFV